MGRLLQLTAREVSGVVFTAYWLEGKDGAAKYAAACAANPAILLPIAAPEDFITGIGKKLFGAAHVKSRTGEALQCGQRIRVRTNADRTAQVDLTERGNAVPGTLYIGIALSATARLCRQPIARLRGKSESA